MQVNEFILCNSKSKCLNRLLGMESFAVAISRQYALNNLIVPSSELYCFNDQNKIQSYHVSTLVRRDFSEIPKINQIIQYSLEGGLFV